jgi:glycine oxidase
MEQTTDAIIIGGGIIGCAIAYYLRKSGVDVVILEQGEIGEQASSAAAGLLAPLGPLSGPGPFADLLLAGFALFPTLVPELEDASGIKLGYEEIGALRTVRNQKRVANLRKRMEAWQPLGLKMYWLDGEEAHKQEPLLSPDICAAIYAPEESQIKAPQVVKAFSLAAINAGAKIRKHTKAINLQKDSNQVTGVQTDQDETIHCDHLILATGAWSNLYNEWFNFTIPVSPLKGEILTLSHPTQPLHHIIFGDALYLSPREDAIIVGATKENTGYDTQVTEKGIEWLNSTATRLVPILKESNIKSSWAGLRPKTPDSQPILGPTPKWCNVTLAVGHNSTGIILSGITGKAIAQLIASQQLMQIIKPFTLDRFSKNCGDYST